MVKTVVPATITNAWVFPIILIAVFIKEDLVGLI
jgi:hypothetical protein